MQSLHLLFLHLDPTACHVPSTSSWQWVAPMCGKEKCDVFKLLWRKQMFTINMWVFFLYLVLQAWRSIDLTVKPEHRAAQPQPNVSYRKNKHHSFNIWSQCTELDNASSNHNSVLSLLFTCKHFITTLLIGPWLALFYSVKTQTQLQTISCNQPF